MAAAREHPYSQYPSLVVRCLGAEAAHDSGEEIARIMGAAATCGENSRRGTSYA